MEQSYAKKRIEELLDLVGLKEREGTLVENYSTGMRIRLSFAKGPSQRGARILFDEPTASLDPQSSRLIRDIIRGLKEKGHAIILTTHNMEEADLLSDRVAIIDHGKIVLLGSPAELKEKVKSNDIIEIEARNISDHVAEALESFSEVSKVPLSQQSIPLAKRECCEFTLRRERSLTQNSRILGSKADNNNQSQLHRAHTGRRVHCRNWQEPSRLGCEQVQGRTPRSRRWPRFSGKASSITFAIPVTSSSIFSYPSCSR